MKHILFAVLLTVVLLPPSEAHMQKGYKVTKPKLPKPIKIPKLADAVPHADYTC